MRPFCSSCEQTRDIRTTYILYIAAAIPGPVSAHTVYTVSTSASDIKPTHQEIAFVHMSICGRYLQVIQPAVNAVPLRLQGDCESHATVPESCAYGYSGTSLQRTPLGPFWLSCIQWVLSIEDTIGTQLAGLYTVEPLYRGHHWDPSGCPVYSGSSL